MMIKFTNRNTDRLGDPLYINKNSIVSVYEEHEEGGSLTTVVYGGFTQPQCWMIEESLTEAVKLINEAK